MKRVFHISSLIFLYLLITAKSCDNHERSDDARDQVRLTSTRDSILSTFESDTLSNASLRAFEVTARINLSDFNDYLTILNDTSVAGIFREKAREMIRMLFISENSVLRFTNPDNLGKREISVKQLLAYGKGCSIPFGKIITDSIRIERSLHQAGDSIYVGKLSFSYIPAMEKTSKKLKQALAVGTVDFIVTKHEKNFGKDTLMIWDIFLGNLE